MCLCLGIDMTHNPEFTTVEFYAAYWDYNDLMDITEQMVSSLVFNIKGSYKVEYTLEEVDKQTGTKKSKNIEINFQPPWPRFSLIEEIEKRGKFTIPRPLDGEECNKFLKDICDKLEINVDVETSAKMLDKLVEHYLEDSIINPAFIIEHPEIMSPLAKYHRSKPELTERFELFVAGLV